MLANRVKETTTTTGTGNLTTAGAVTNFQTFNTAFGTDRRFIYWLVDATNNIWETGIGYLSASTTLVRETVLDNSSNTTSALSLSAGTKDIFCAQSELTGYNAFSGVSSSAGYLASGSHVNATTTKGLTTDRVFYVPYEFLCSAPITALALEVTTSSASSVARMGLYEILADGEPGELIAEGNGTIDTSTTGFKTISLAASLFTPPGWYFIAVVADAAITIRGVPNANLKAATPLGSTTGGTLNTHCYENIGSSWSAMPTPAGSVTLAGGSVMKMGVIV